jgi:hypothetical protein
MGAKDLADEPNLWNLGPMKLLSVERRVSVLGYNFTDGEREIYAKT